MVIKSSFYLFQKYILRLNKKIKLLREISLRNIPDTLPSCIAEI